MKTLLLVLCLTSACANLRADNLLKNPSFEDVGPSDDTAANWNRWGDWINRETGWTPTHSGTCLIGYHHWEITSAANSGIWQDVPAKAGQKFTFSIFASADAPDSGSNPAQTIELRLEATTGGGNQVTIASVSTPISDLGKEPGWHKLTVSGTTPESNIRVLVVITPAANAPRGGAVKIDDASLDISQ